MENKIEKFDSGWLMSAGSKEENKTSKELREKAKRRELYFSPQDDDTYMFTKSELNALIQQSIKEALPSEDLNYQNLAALVKGIELNLYQRSLAVNEFHKIIDFINHLKNIKS